MARWEFVPSDNGGASYWQLLVVSFLSLFLELLLIRWVSSEVRIFAYFKNFVLVACFLGFGLGCHLSRRAINLLAFVAPLTFLAFCVSSPWVPMRRVIALLPDMIAAGSNVQVWGVPALDLSVHDIPGLVLGLGITAVLFLLIAFILVPVGQMVGWYLENSRNGIAGYSLNLLGGLAGTLAYAVLCFLYQPPAMWFVAAAVPTFVLLRRRRRLAGVTVVGLIACALLSVAPHGPNTTVYWSPYQKLALTAIPSQSAPESYKLWTNGSWHQQIFNLSPEFVTSHPQLFLPAPWRQILTICLIGFKSRGRRVLVLGAGMGNDVAAALRNTRADVTAVEIDPLILKLGRKFHFEKPYSSPRVKVVVEDARNYVQNASEKYDLIVFSLLDSHTTSSSYTNIRIDNYVYTVEALEAARRLLNPDGVFIVKFQSETPWIAGRLERSLSTVFGQPPLRMAAWWSDQGTGGSFFITGSADRIQNALKDTTIAEVLKDGPGVATAPAPVTTDDWPYFYQRAPGLPLNVVLISLLLMAMTSRVLFGKGLGGTSSAGWHFFFLGAGFMLLEAQIISKMALLFGTTWVVNCIVISGLLVLMILGNFVVQKWPRTPYAVGYAGIAASLLLGWSVPLRAFFFASVFLKVSLATLVLCAPVFFASLIFIRSFAQARFSASALGSNLFGALAGGLLESLSLWTGLRSLLIVAALLYLASYLTLRAVSELGSAERTSEPLAAQAAAVSLPSL